jgi:hypothetical protein
MILFLPAFLEAQNLRLQLHAKSNEVWRQEPHEQGAIRTVRVKIRHTHSLNRKPYTGKFT